MGRSKKATYIVRVVGTYIEERTNSLVAARELATKLARERPSQQVQISKEIEKYELSFEDILRVLLPGGAVFHRLAKWGLLRNQITVGTSISNFGTWTIDKCFVDKDAQKLLEHPQARVYLDSFDDAEIVSEKGKYGLVFMPSTHKAADSYFAVGQIVDHDFTNCHDLMYLVKPLVKIPRLVLGNCVERQMAHGNFLVRARHFSEWNEYFFREQAKMIR